MTEKLCECGCAETVETGNRFIHGHNVRSKHPMQGRRHSEESRNKQRESHIGLPSGAKGSKHSLESRKKMSESHKGVPLSEKHRASIGKTSLRSWASKSEADLAEWKINIGVGQTGKVISEDARQNMSKARIGKHYSPRTEFKSEKMKEKYRDPAYVEKMRKAWNIKPNKAEILMLRLLDDLYPGEWKYTGDFSFMINGKNPDFVNCNGRKLIIEYFGDHWHAGHNPEDRAAAFSPFGYKTLVIWGREMKDVKTVIGRIQEFTEG